jgi:hypothetical protein
MDPTRLYKLALSYYLSAKISLAAKTDELKLKYPNIDIDDLSKHDPSGKNKYLDWMAKQIVKGHSTSDLYPTIEYFHKNINKLDQKDIDQYQDLKDLENIVKDISSVKTKTQQIKEFKADVPKLYEDENVAVIRVDNKQASCIYGNNTRWCITMRKANYYEMYASQNAIFYFILRKEPKQNDYDKVCIVFVRNLKDNNIVDVQYWNQVDKKVQEGQVSAEIADLSNIVSILRPDAQSRPKSILAKIENNEAKDEEIDELFRSDLDDSMVFSMRKLRTYEPKLSDEALINYNLCKDLDYFKNIVNPTEKQKLLAVKANGFAIEYIKNPSEAVQIAAVAENGRSIQFIKNPSEAVQLAAVNENGYAIEYIKNPSEEVQLAAANQNGDTIRHIKNPSEAVQVAAVTGCFQARNIRFIDNPSEAVQLAAVKNKVEAIEHIKNPYPSVIELYKILKNKI